MDVDALAQKQFRALQEKNVELTQVRPRLVLP